MQRLNQISRRLSYSFAVSVVTGLAAFGSSVVYAVSFDCGAAVTPVEKMICSDPELGALDDEYVRAYKAARSGTGDRDAFKAASRTWIKEVRDQCETGVCLAEAYVQRIADLKNQSGTATANESVPVGEQGPAAEQPLTDLSAPVAQLHSSKAFNAEPAVHQYADDSLANTSSMTFVRGFAAHPEQYMKLGLWGVAVSIAALLLLGMTNKVVIFYDVKDALMSVLSFVALPISVGVATSLMPEGSKSEDLGGTSLEQVVMLLGGLIAAWAAYKSIKNAVTYNRSVPLGLLVGIFKLGVSAAMTLTAFGYLQKIFDEKRTRREAAIAFLALAILGIVWKLLINGEKVYEQNGWRLKNGDDESTITEDGVHQLDLYDPNSYYDLIELVIANESPLAYRVGKSKEVKVLDIDMAEPIHETLTRDQFLSLHVHGDVIHATVRKACEIALNRELNRSTVETS